MGADEACDTGTTLPEVSVYSVWYCVIGMMQKHLCYPFCTHIRRDIIQRHLNKEMVWLNVLHTGKACLDSQNSAVFKKVLCKKYRLLEAAKKCRVKKRAKICEYYLG